MTYIEKIINVETGETIERPYTKDEIAAVEAKQLEMAKLAEKEVEAASAKAALLEKLGITEDEAKLLLS
jgi:hypothetical protein